MRPRTLAEFFGQDHIIGPGRLLRRAIQADMISSLIFYGPPGTGKTTLARVIANTTESSFLSLNAVLAGVKDVREAIDKAKQSLELWSKKTILFVDEVHRWNKAQQDALLPWVENGTVILIGATTHNPFFEVNSALVSRSRIFQLKPLTRDDMLSIARAALTDPERGYGSFTVTIDDNALSHLVDVADGDARALLGALQLAVETSVTPFPPPDGTEIRIDQEIAEDSIQKKAVLYDKEGDYHFDIISAFIKSLRGSDPDAALYWMAKMIHGGEDPRFLFRRMMILACEDVGLADPNALVIVEAAAAAFERIGMPEGNYHLAHAALYLATCPKSNSAIGYFDALKVVETEHDHEVPNHLRDDNRDKESFGHGDGYLYPHAYRNHWVAQAYLPAALAGRVFYEPGTEGYEGRVRDVVQRRREMQLESVLPEPPAEVLTYSRSADRSMREWARRADAALSAHLTSIRDTMIARSRLARHHRVLVTGRRATVPLWDAVRRAPEGRVWALIDDEQRYQTANHYALRLGELERPIVVQGGPDALVSLLSSEASSAAEDEVRFDVILAADAMLTSDERRAFFELTALAAPESRLVVSQRIPRRATRLNGAAASLAGDNKESRELVSLLAQAEESLFTDPSSVLVNWDLDDLVDEFARAGWTVTDCETIDYEETRRLREEQVDEWLDTNRAESLGSVVAKLSDSSTVERLVDWMKSSLCGPDIPWSTTVALITAQREEPGR